MAVNSVIAPYFAFADASGKPLDAGYIFIGMPNFEARSTPKASFFDPALTIPTGTLAGVGIRTLGGFPVQNGSAAVIYVDGDFSITVTDKNGVLIFSQLNRSFQYGIETTSAGLFADGNLAGVGVGFAAEPTTGLIRSAAGVMQDVVLGVPVADQSQLGTRFLLPAYGAGMNYLTPDPQAIINGDFSIWQAGTSFSALGYSADQWLNDFVGGACTTTRQMHTVGDVFGVSTPEYFLREAVSGQTLTTHYAGVTHRIEGVRSFAGQTVTLSFGQEDQQVQATSQSSFLKSSAQADRLLQRSLLHRRRSPSAVQWRSTKWQSHCRRLPEKPSEPIAMTISI